MLLGLLRSSAQSVSELVKLTLEKTSGTDVPGYRLFRPCGTAPMQSSTEDIPGLAMAAAVTSSSWPGKGMQYFVCTNVLSARAPKGNSGRAKYTRCPPVVEAHSVGAGNCWKCGIRAVVGTRRTGFGELSERGCFHMDDRLPFLSDRFIEIPINRRTFWRFDDGCFHLNCSSTVVGDLNSVQV